VLRTRSPLDLPEQAPWISFDLHVLSTPPAFILSQDQTLQQNRVRPSRPAEASVQASNECQRALRVERKIALVAASGCDGRPRRVTMPTRIRVAAGWEADSEIDRQSLGTPEGGRRIARTGVLSSLPFSRSRSSGTHRDLGRNDRGRRWCRAFPEGVPFREAELEDSSSGGLRNTRQEKTSTR
jgi:hypothetical protein